MGLRRSRSVGLPKTHIAHVAIATAMNLVQLAHWLNGDVPEQTRTSAFKRVMQEVTSSSVSKGRQNYISR